MRVVLDNMYVCMYVGGGGGNMYALFLNPLSRPVNWKIYEVITQNNPPLSRPSKYGDIVDGRDSHRRCDLVG